MFITRESEHLDKLEGVSSCGPTRRIGEGEIVMHIGCAGLVVRWLERDVREADEAARR